MWKQFCPLNFCVPHVAQFCVLNFSSIFNPSIFYFVQDFGRGCCHVEEALGERWQQNSRWGEQIQSWWFISLVCIVRSVKATADDSCPTFHRPVLRSAAELPALLSLLSLLQHIWCVLWSITAHPQEELCQGGHSEGVSGPLLSGGETGQGEFTSEFPQIVKTNGLQYIMCLKRQWHSNLS